MIKKPGQCPRLGADLAVARTQRVTSTHPRQAMGVLTSTKAHGKQEGEQQCQVTCPGKM